MRPRPREICPKCDQRIGINHADSCRSNLVRTYERERDRQRVLPPMPPIRHFTAPIGFSVVTIDRVADRVSLRMEADYVGGRVDACGTLTPAQARETARLLLEKAAEIEGEQAHGA